MTIRPATAADLAAIHAIEQAVDGDWTFGMLQSSFAANDRIWVLQQEQQLIGFYVLGLASDVAELLNIAVHPAHQGHGHGRHVLQECLNAARTADKTECWLEVRRSNSAATRLYAALGFAEMRIRKGYYATANGTREDALIMRAQLT